MKAKTSRYNGLITEHALLSSSDTLDGNKF